MQAIEETIVNAFYHRDYQTREPIEIRIYHNSMVFINYGGPDRSIKMQDFNMGRVRPRRYRNRRLGDFLKELELTEGRATGIPTIFKTLKDNGSPKPYFNTDDDRTFFEVELFVHPSFIQQPPIKNNVQTLEKTLVAINRAFDIILEQAGDDVNTELNAIAGAIAENTQIADNVIIDIMDGIVDAVANAIADAIADTITKDEIKLLAIALQPLNREMLLAGIKLTNHRKNYEEYAKPLIDLNWLSMTIPRKPTSPKQQYITTIKGRLAIRFLKLKHES